METIYKTLAIFLASINLTEKGLKRLTGLSIPRLRIIFKQGNVTKEEFMLLLKAMTVHQAADLVFASQAGNFNQNGVGNEQNINITNNYVLIIMRRLGLLPIAAPARALPTQPVLANVAQQQIISRLPGSQATPIGNSIEPINCAF